ncbi:MAG: rod shape-determining protein RodA [Candidatus Symbiothrix sp.]|jgi:rod shape determining protein RodA|nr:rod shape-determining protein RodA [Candidatus Symbiothrix sp.]
MSFRKSNIWEELDWFTVTLYGILVIAGWFSVYAATYDFDHASIFDLSGRSGQQMIWIITSVVIGFSLLMIESSWFEIFSFWIYCAIIALLVVTIFVAPDIKGSRSWLVMGPVRIQPAEFAKFATALALAKLMSTYRFDLTRGKSMLSILMLILLPMVLIFLQKETGSALVFLAFFFVLYREGMPGAVLFAGGAAILFFILVIRYATEIILNPLTPAGEFMVLCIIVAFIVVLLLIYAKNSKSIKNIFWLALGIGVVTAVVNRLYPVNLCWAAWVLLGSSVLYLLGLYIKERKACYTWIALFALASVGFLYSVDYVFDEVMEPHQQTRIQVALGVIDDPSGAGYNVNQSKIAIGSGGIIGKGYLNGTQTKLKYVPEQDTDFIFCTIGEEKGFLGSVAILVGFLLLIVRLIYLADRQKSAFHRVYGYSVACIIFFHVAVNIGMVIGIMPVIGIPLPFFSYGGSSLWAFTILLFIFLRLDISRSDRSNA